MLKNEIKNVPTDRRSYGGNRNKKIARKGNGSPSKCLNNAINQQLKTGNKLRNGTKVNNNNFVIDDCDGEAQGSNRSIKKNSSNNDDTATNAIGSEVRERNVDFVEEWMNTFAFLSRKFIFFPPFELTLIFLDTNKSFSVWDEGSYDKGFNGRQSFTT